MKKTLTFKQIILLLSVVVPVISFAHTGHGNSTISGFLHNSLYHEFPSWFFLLVTLSAVIYLSIYIVSKIKK